MAFARRLPRLRLGRDQADRSEAPEQHFPAADASGASFTAKEML
ncbi:hypothetical protein [Paenibacillus tengchongensis]|nr:hypothetical protein [Paenibacillus tengchongensis]